ncbi:hypothetical protein Pint_25458 [Pistacia integerrima]|uniref:Uncharacterized protein n=1 Tax=Pistacia integerrima TaxID=434235 RepID=A0ACC0YFB0_9ROSI|nr:hypothetical protein Pint_25458 [Pistacia integerrima]
MEHKMRQLTIILETFFTILIASRLISTVVCQSNVIHANASNLNQWIDHTVQEYMEKKAEVMDLGNEKNSQLDDALAMAEKNLKVITVNKVGSGDFKSLTDAVNSIPIGNANRVVIKIGGGEYHEKITIDRSKQFVTFYGDPKNMPRIAFAGTALKYGTFNSSTVIVESDYFMAVNVIFVNSAPMPNSRSDDSQAVALRISGDKATFYNCKFIGFQDTLCDDKGRHFFKGCHVEGTVDFIFGNGQSVYMNTTLQSVAKGLGVITAQGREKPTEDSGFTFVHCNITGTGDIYLGRAWKESPRVIFAYTYMGALINSEGWSNSMYGETGDHKSMFYGEYKCMGPGASSSGRAKFARILTDAEAEPFLSTTYLDGNKWILPPPNV